MNFVFAVNEDENKLAGEQGMWYISRIHHYTHNRSLRPMRHRS
jgi:hypothetical protein